MKHSIIRLVSLVVLLSLALAACGQAATPAPVVTEAPASEVATEVATQAPMAEGELPEVNPGDVTGDFYTAGSSTVFPLSEAIYTLFVAEGYTGNGKTDSVGTGGGFERFCKTGESDIANASRAIKDSEAEACTAIGRAPIEFRVGTDAIAVVVSKENTFVKDLTIEQLGKIFSDKAEKWSDVDPSWPAEPILRFVPGTDSGTFDFFVEEVIQKPNKIEKLDEAKEIALKAANQQASEDDNVLVQGVEGSPYAIGYFGFAYFNEQKERLTALTLEGVEPNFTTAEDGSYKLSRPLFIYSDAKIMKEKPQVAAFINFYLTNVNDVIGEVGYFPASEEALKGAKQAWLDAMK